MFVFSLNNTESFNYVYTLYQKVDDYRTKRGLESIPSLLIGIQGNYMSLIPCSIISFVAS